MEVTPHCDCPQYSDAPIVPDIGILASHDPVAINKCSTDLINAKIGLTNSALGEKCDEESLKPGSDKIRLITGRDWLRLLKLREKAGLGSLDYEIIEID